MAQLRGDPLADQLQPFGRMLEWSEFFRLLGPASAPAVKTVRVEELIEDGILTIRAELPDIDPDSDVELSYRDGVLEVRVHTHSDRAKVTPSR